MKKILYLTAILFFLASCSTDKSGIYCSVTPLNLDFDSRSSLPQTVSVSTDASDWEYNLQYETELTNWCSIEKQQNSLKISVIPNDGPERRAFIDILIGGNVNTTIYVTQSAVYYTEDEQQLIKAKNILENRYNFIQLEIDYEKHNLKYNGVLRYQGDGLNLSIPVTLYNFASSSYVSMSSGDNEDYFAHAFGNIYTGSYSIELPDEIIRYDDGDFSIQIGGYGEKEEENSINIKLTQDGKTAEIKPSKNVIDVTGIPSSSIYESQNIDIVGKFKYDWRISTDANWISFEPATGRSGTHSINMRVEESELTTGDRTAIITFWSGDKSLQRTFVQRKKTEQISLDRIKIFTLGGVNTGGGNWTATTEFYVTVTSNSSWRTNIPSRYTLSPSAGVAGETKVKITVKHWKNLPAQEYITFYTTGGTQCQLEFEIFDVNS